jgi:hypothetical protein
MKSSTNTYIQNQISELPQQEQYAVLDFDTMLNVIVWHQYLVISPLKFLPHL